MDSRLVLCFFFQAEDGIRDLVRSRGLGDVYKRQGQRLSFPAFRSLWVAQHDGLRHHSIAGETRPVRVANLQLLYSCLLYTSPSPRDRTRSRMPSSA